MQKKLIGKLGLSLLGSVLGADTLALILFVCLGNWLNHFGTKLAYTIFACLVLVWMIYTTSWNEGFRDPNRVKYGHIRKFLPKGLLAGCLAEIPFAVVTLIFTLDQSLHWNNLWIRLVYYFLHIVYVFILNHFQTAIWILWVLILPLPLVAAVSYILGYYQIELLGRLVYKRKKTAKTEKR